MERVNEMMIETVNFTNSLVDDSFDNTIEDFTIDGAEFEDDDWRGMMVSLKKSFKGRD